MADTIRLWTIERRGEAWILMGWPADVSRGPLEVRRFGGLNAAKLAAESAQGGALAWRDGRGDETKHGVVVAADVA